VPNALRVGLLPQPLRGYSLLAAAKPSPELGEARNSSRRRAA